MASRLTFRNIVTHEAWQHKIRNQRQTEWVESGKYQFWNEINLSLKKAQVREINRVTAEKIILEYEWLGDMAVTNQFYGIFFDMFCGGVICINTNGQASHGEKQFGLKKGDVSYFARGACTFWSPTGTASRLLSYALKLEKQRGAKLAIAFADNEAGEYGTVYQATNWYFIGYSNDPSKQFYKNNRILDTRTFTHQAAQKKLSTAKYRELLLKNGWKWQKTNPKCKYVYILADEPEKSEIYRHIKNKIRSYPKRPAAIAQRECDGQSCPEMAFESTSPLKK